VGIQRVVLENHRDITTARCHVHDIFAVDPNGAVVDLLEARQHPQARRLPTARWSNQHKELAVVDREVEPVDRWAGAVGEHAGRALKCDSCHENVLPVGRVGWVQRSGVRWGLRCARIGLSWRRACNVSPVDFLVEIEVRLPSDLDEAVRTRLLNDELVRGKILADAGLLRAIWRVPGRLANRAIWTAADATALHVALISLPLWPYMDVVVTPLAHHPLSGVCGGLAVATGGAELGDA
jgi:muconolactone D-isomerase